MVRALLEACGDIKEWKPATDPKTGASKGFGFCTYKEAEGVMIALQVLNGLEVDGQALALKCNSVRKKMIVYLSSKAGNLIIQVFYIYYFTALSYYYFPGYRSLFAMVQGKL